jgi:hypothetical protein
MVVVWFWKKNEGVEVNSGGAALYSKNCGGDDLVPSPLNSRSQRWGQLYQWVGLSVMQVSRVVVSCELWVSHCREWPLCCSATVKLWHLNCYLTGVGRNLFHVSFINCKFNHTLRNVFFTSVGMRFLLHLIFRYESKKFCYVQYRGLYLTLIFIMFNFLL